MTVRHHATHATHTDFVVKQYGPGLDHEHYMDMGMGMAGGMATAYNLYVRHHGTSWLMYFLRSPASVAGSSGFAAKSEKPISEHLRIDG